MDWGYNMLTQNEFEDIIEGVLARVKETLINKGHDYTNKDPIENFKLLEEYGIQPTQAVMQLIAIKWNRLKNLIMNNKQPKNESVDDNELDLICYTILLHVVREEIKRSSYSKKI